MLVVNLFMYLRYQKVAIFVEFFLWFFNYVCFSVNDKIKNCVMESSKLKQTRHNSTTNLTKYPGVGKDWLETEVPTLRDVLRKGLHIQENLLLSDTLDR